MTLTTIPVGGLMMFAGDIMGVRLDELESEGWLFCDGAECGQADYPELFARIGANYGGSETTFRLPDLRGRFVRGTDHGAKVDPDAAGRVAANTGGSTGDAVGSTQPYATGLPTTAQFHTSTDGQHSHQAPHLSSDYHNTPLSAWGDTCMAWTDDTHFTSADGDHSHQAAGGDVETRPANAYLFFFIKFRNITTEEA